MRTTWLALLVLAGCASPPPSMIDSTKSQLAVREYQTRTYETTDTAMVMKAVLNALQDEGFIVKTANTELGLITASKEKSDREWHGGILYAYDVTYSWDCSANVSLFGRETKVRVNVRLTTKRSPSGKETISEIDDPTFYQGFFSKVDKSVFIQKERL